MRNLARQNERSPQKKKENSRRTRSKYCFVWYPRKKDFCKRHRSQHYGRQRNGGPHAFVQKAPLLWVADEMHFCTGHVGPSHRGSYSSPVSSLKWLESGNPLHCKTHWCKGQTGIHLALYTNPDLARLHRPHKLCKTPNPHCSTNHHSRKWSHTR